MRDATTPPPPKRLRTPPAPLHGAGYHSYEPYSPRRSTRVSTLRKTQSLAAPSTSSSQPLSPPSSPVAQSSSQQHNTPARPTPVRHSLFTKNRPLANPRPSPVSMLPTPNKTPRKRDTAALHSTARILNFKPASTNQVMPSTRKRVKSRLTLDDEDDRTQSDINVFTDIQDRIPHVDNTEENPFVGPRKTKSRSRAKTAPAAMSDAAATHDEGVVFMFRGKKIFRRFESEERDESDASTGSNASLKRKAGAAACRPLTRSSFKPRLLFPTAESDHDADEEALTDIEDPESTSAPEIQSLGHDSITPAKKASVHPATPPSSHRHTRSVGKKLALYTAGPTAETSDSDAPASPSATPLPQKGKQAPPFAEWMRHKTADARPKRARTSTSDPELPTKRGRTSLFSSVGRP